MDRTIDSKTKNHITNISLFMQTTVFNLNTIIISGTTYIRCLYIIVIYIKVFKGK